MVRKDKSEKRKTGSSGMGVSILMVVIFLWMGGLTFLWWTTAQKSGGNDLEERVTRLETKASRVVKKINPPGSKTSPQLEARIKKLENKLGAINTNTSTASADGTDAAASPDNASVSASSAATGCNCDGLAERMDRLENLVLTKNGDAQKNSRPVASASSTDANTAEDVVAAPAEKPDKTARAAAPVSRKKKKQTAAVKRQAPRKRADKAVRTNYHTRGDHQFIDDKDRIYGAGGKSIYEMTRQYGPMVGDSLENEKNIQSLAPGAGVYPYSGSTYQ
jgi:hypothetical protein